MNAITFSAGEITLIVTAFLGVLCGVVAFLFKALDAANKAIVQAKDEQIVEVCKERDEWRDLCREHIPLTSRSMDVIRTLTTP